MLVQRPGWPVVGRWRFWNDEAGWMREQAPSLEGLRRHVQAHTLIFEKGRYGVACVRSGPTRPTANSSPVPLPVRPSPPGAQTALQQTLPTHRRWCAAPGLPDC